MHFQELLLKPKFIEKTKKNQVIKILFLSQLKDNICCCSNLVQGLLRIFAILEKHSNKCFYISAAYKQKYLQNATTISYLMS